MTSTQRQPLLRSSSDSRYDAERAEQVRVENSNRDEYLSKMGYTPLIFENEDKQRDYLTSSPATLLRKQSVRNTPQETPPGKSWIPSAGSIRGSVFNLAGATLGAGALSLPYAIAVSGVTFGVLQLVVAALLTVYTIRLLIRAGERTGLMSYEDLALYCFGKCGALFVEMNILIFCFSIAVAYLVTLGDIIHPLGKEVFPEDSILTERWFLMTVACCSLMLPLSMLKDISSLQTSSTLGVFSIIFLVLSVCFRSLTIVGEKGVNHTVEWGMNTSQGISVVLGMPIVMFAFTCQVNVFSIYTELQRPNIRRMNKVVDRATGISFLLYLAIGVCSYLAFGGSLLDREAKGNILMSFSSKDPLIAICRAAITFTVAVAFPLNIFPCRFTIEMMFFSRWPASNFRHNVLSVSLVLGALAVAIFCPSINVVFGIIGGTCSAVVPALYMLRLGKTSWFRASMLPHLILLVSAIVLGLFTTSITIWSNFFH